MQQHQLAYESAKVVFHPHCNEVRGERCLRDNIRIYLVTDLQILDTGSVFFSDRNVMDISRTALIDLAGMAARHPVETVSYLPRLHSGLDQNSKQWIIWPQLP